jgi:hypothetical protein
MPKIKNTVCEQVLSCCLVKDAMREKVEFGSLVRQSAKWVRMGLRTGILENGGAEDPIAQREDCHKRLEAASQAHQSGKVQTALEGQDQGIVIKTKVVAEMETSTRIWTGVKIKTLNTARSLAASVD